MEKQMIIDCDTHFMPLDAFTRVSDKFKSLVPVLKLDENGCYITLDFPGRPPVVPFTTPLPPPGTGWQNVGLVNMEVRIQEYAQLGIERSCVLPQFSGWWSYLIEPELATEMAHSLNLAVLEIMKKYPRHASGIALVALQDVEGAIREMGWAHENGFGGIALDKVFPVKDHPYGEMLGGQRQLRPFFRAAAQLEMPIFLHAVQHGHRTSNAPFFQREGLDFFAPNEGQMSLVSLFSSGLLDEFPQLQFVFTEAGTEFIRPLVEKLDQSFGTALVDYDNEDATPYFRGRGALPGPDSQDVQLNRAKALVPLDVYLEKNKHSASYYFKKHFFFTIETEEAGLPEAISFLGADRFLFATDYPHDDPGGSMKYRDVKLLHANKEISEHDKNRLRSDNAREFLRLG